MIGNSYIRLMLGKCACSIIG